MRAESLLLTDPRQLVWSAEELPLLGPHDLLLRTIAGAISMGTEMPLYRGNARVAVLPHYPLMTGYESLAEVVACGVEVRDVSVGDRVVSFYGHRTAAVMRESRVIPVPDGISDACALLLILACDTAKGISKLPLDSATEALVTGAGAIGLLTVFNLAARGLTAIDVAEPRPERCALARRLGARAPAAPAAQDWLQTEYHIGFECSSRDRAFHFLQERLVAQGKICVLADGNVEPLTLTPAFHAKELLIVGSSDGLDYAEYARWFWDAVRARHEALESLFEEMTTAENLADVFAQYADNAAPPVKVFVQYPQDENKRTMNKGTSETT
jgi:alcohol dehydrogenase